MSSPAAWHPDPTGRHDHRWWDGERWTEHVADAGQAAVDPLDQTTPDTGATDTPGTGAAGGWQQPAQDQPAHDQSFQDRPAEGQPTQEQPAWQQPGQQQPAQQPWQSQQTFPSGSAQPASAGTDGVAIAALVVGILSLLTAIFLIGMVGGLVAAVLGFVARGRIRRSGQAGNGMAITGIVTGILSILIGAAVIAFGFALFNTGTDTFQNYTDCLEETDDPDFCDQQLEEDLLERFGS